MTRASAPVAPLVALVVSALSSSALAGACLSAWRTKRPRVAPRSRDFVAAVAARGGDFDAQAPSARESVMVVAIRKDDGGFSGAFQVRDAATASNKREVHGPSCGEVVDALAMVTAIALRSDVAADATVAPVRGRHPARGAAGGAPASTQATRGVASARAVARAATRIFPSRTEKIAGRCGNAPLRSQRSVMVTAGAVVGLIPYVFVPDYDLSLVVAPFVTTPEGAQRIPGLVFRLHGGFMFPPTYRSAEHDHRSEWRLVRHRPLPVSSLRHARAGAPGLR